MKLKGKSDVAMYPVSLHVRDGSRSPQIGKNNYVWAIQTDGGHPILNYSLSEFKRLPDSARVAIVHVVHKSEVADLRAWVATWK